MVYQSKSRISNLINFKDVVNTRFKLVSAIFINFFSPNYSPSKTVKNVFYFVKSSFRSRDIHIFVIFPLPHFRDSKEQMELE